MIIQNKETIETVEHLLPKVSEIRGPAGRTQKKTPEP